MTDLLIERANRKACSHVQRAIGVIVLNDLKVSYDDYGVAQIWCPKCDMGITWDEEDRRKRLRQSSEEGSADAE